MNIFITLDYELFLGTETGTPEQCLVRPMEELCKVADKHGFRYVIFVDAAYLLRMQQLKDNYPQLERDFQTVTDNLRLLAKQGHDIQLHFHPQWLKSGFDEAKGWQLKSLPYKLSDLEEDEAFALFHEAKSLLDSVIGYPTTAFRAGGYCLTSFKKYKELFEQEGIIIDSSVARNGYVDSPVHAYDYRNIPNKIVYRFSSDVCKEQWDGIFTELSISSVLWSGLYYMFRVRPIMASYRPKEVYGDGKSVVDGNEQTGLLSKLMKFIKPYKGLASIDGIRSCQLEKIFERERNTGRDTLVLIGHPKLASDASVANFDAFIGKHRELTYCTTEAI